MLRNFLLVILAFTLGACGTSKYVKEMDNPKTAMVFGYIAASKGPMAFEWVQLRHIDAAGDDDYYTTRADEEGMFYAENLPLGQYYIHRMGRGNSPMGGNVVQGGGVVWSLGEEGSKMTIMQVKKPGLNYLGSFKFIYIKGEGFFGSDSFRFERAANPPEKELLNRLLPFAKDTRWEASIKKRAAEL